MLRKGMSEKLNLTWSYDQTEARHITGFKLSYIPVGEERLIALHTVSANERSMSVPLCFGNEGVYRFQLVAENYGQGGPSKPFAFDVEVYDDSLPPIPGDVVMS